MYSYEFYMECAWLCWEIGDLVGNYEYYLLACKAEECAPDGASG